MWDLIMSHSYKLRRIIRRETILGSVVRASAFVLASVC